MFTVIILGHLIEYALGYIENCDYLDVSQHSNSNIMDCGKKGCCGSFQERHCCRGPIVTVLAVFGSIIGILIVVVTIAVCYSSYRRRLRQRTQTLPLDNTDQYEIPLPSPPLPTPMYTSPRMFRPPNPAFRENHPPPTELSPPPLILKHAKP